MKIDLTFSKLIILGTIILMTFQLTGCKADDIGDMKQNNLKVDEYNETIELYNKVATNFTGLARAIDREIEKDDEDMQTRISKKYNEKNKKVLDYLKKLEEKEFKYEEVGAVMGEVEPMISKMYIYLDFVGDLEAIDWDKTHDFEKEINELYEDVLNQSATATKKFEEIYQTHLVRKKD